MKSASRKHPGRFALDAADWELMRASPASLMLVRGRPWHQEPRFAAMVDMRDPETPSAAKEILHTAEYLAVGCGASLDAVYCEREPAAADRAACAEGLQGLAREHGIRADRIHVLSGDPDEELPAFASRNDYDVLVLGVLTHRRSFASWVGKLTGRMADTLDCDIVLVKEPAVAAAIRARNASVLWQGVSGD
jgi:universal stress protein E